MEAHGRPPRGPRLLGGGQRLARQGSPQGIALPVPVSSPRSPSPGLPGTLFARWVEEGRGPAPPSPGSLSSHPHRRIWPALGFPLRSLWVSGNPEVSRRLEPEMASSSTPDPAEGGGDLGRRQGLPGALGLLGVGDRACGESGWGRTGDPGPPRYNEPRGREYAVPAPTSKDVGLLVPVGRVPTHLGGPRSMAWGAEASGSDTNYLSGCRRRRWGGGSRGPWSEHTFSPLGLPPPGAGPTGKDGSGVRWPGGTPKGLPLRALLSTKPVTVVVVAVETQLKEPARIEQTPGSPQAGKK